MGTTEKSSPFINKFASQLPGPGNYSTKNKTIGKDAQSFTFKGKPKEYNKKDVPGPGMYDPNNNVVKDKTITYKMGSTTRGDLVSKEA